MSKQKKRGGSTGGNERTNQEQGEEPSDAVMEAYQQMLHSGSNEYGVEQYTKEDKHQLELIQELQKIKPPQNIQQCHEMG